MTTYIATFFSHFGAIRFHKEMKEKGIEGTLMPVPRKVSSSCGTCVRLEAEHEPNFSSDDSESLFRMESDGSFTLVKSNM